MSARNAGRFIIQVSRGRAALNANCHPIAENSHLPQCSPQVRGNLIAHSARRSSPIVKWNMGGGSDYHHMTDGGRPRC
jgi:hypothetical protein